MHSFFFLFDLFIKEITITHKLQHHFYPFAFKTLYAYKNMSSILKHHYFSPFHPSFLHKIFIISFFSLSDCLLYIIFESFKCINCFYTHRNQSQSYFQHFRCRDSTYISITSAQLFKPYLI